MRFSDLMYKLTGRTIQFSFCYARWKWKWTGRKTFNTVTIYAFGPLWLSVGKRPK